MARYVLPNDPALSAAVVTPNDAAELPNFSRMLYIADGGTGWEPLADPPAGQGPRHNIAR